MLFTSDVDMLITYSSFVEAFFTMLSVSSMLWSRWKRPNINRPIKVCSLYKIPQREIRQNNSYIHTTNSLQVSLWIPITYVVVSLFLVVLPCYVRPYEVSMGVGITLLGIPVYYLCVVWQTKPMWFQNLLSKRLKWYDTHPYTCV